MFETLKAPLAAPEFLEQRESTRTPYRDERRPAGRQYALAGASNQHDPLRPEVREAHNTDPRAVRVASATDYRSLAEADSRLNVVANIGG